MQPPFALSTATRRNGDNEKGSVSAVESIAEVRTSIRREQHKKITIKLHLGIGHDKTTRKKTARILLLWATAILN